MQLNGLLKLVQASMQNTHRGFMPYLLAASAGKDAALPLLCCSFLLLLYRQGMVARCSGGKEQGSGHGWRGRHVA
ncbi:hypothetical protein [Paraflavitalea speifideaquila]|uniref:hypothetical protein n=1 Tax=Paraflavitalea speifideaquila TaxID=3076558 RepID=UPI0028F15CBA|nr:hypothetical protein [Paraflavitalea speifideiaquila]